MPLRTMHVLAMALASRGVEASHHLHWCGLRHGEEPNDLVGCRQISAHETDEAKRILSTLPGLIPLPLEQLDLSSSKISKAGVAQLASLLSTRTSQIKDLDLSGCDVRDGGIANLVDAILAAGNKTKLEGFDVSNNGITSEGAISLAKLVSAEGVHIDELMISGNPIGQRGALAIAHALQKNKRVASSLQYRNIGALSSNMTMRARHKFEFFPVNQHDSHLGLTSNIDDEAPTSAPESNQSNILDKGPPLEKVEEIFYRGLYARFLAECSEGCSWPSCRLLKRTGLVASENNPINEDSCAALSQRMASVLQINRTATNNGADAFIAFMQDSPLGIIARAVHRAIKKMSKQDPFRPADSDAWLPPDEPLSAQVPSAPEELDLDAPLAESVHGAPLIASSAPQALPSNGENALTGPDMSAIKREGEMGNAWAGFWGRLL